MEFEKIKKSLKMTEFTSILFNLDGYSNRRPAKNSKLTHKCKKKLLKSIKFD